MLKRVITGIVLVLLLVPTIALSRTPFLPAVTSVLSVLGIYELLGCYGWQRKYAALVPALTAALGMQWAARYANDAIEVTACITFGLLVWELFCAVFSRRDFTSSQAVTLAGMSIYIGFGFSALVLLCDSKGLVMLPLAFLLPWGSDTMAYFSGFLFGKHKLIPDVSPKKTVEGAIGGVIGAALIAVVYGYLIQSLTDYSPSPLLLGISGAAVSVLAQCGDLIMSLIKRENGIKDYGTLFPGHGGVLDRFDSVLISAPTLYFIGYFASEWQFFA